MKLYKISCSSSSPPYLTKVFLSNEQAYKSRCDSFKEEFPIQIVCQDLTWVLAHNLEHTNCRKLSHPTLMLLHRLHHDPPPPSLTGCKVQPPHSSSYFIARTHLHKCVASFWNHHNHFPNKTLLKLPIFRIPKPPVPMAKQTVSHATKENLNSSSEAPHKKLLVISLTYTSH